MKRFLGMVVFLIGALAAFMLACACLDFKRHSYPVYITLKADETQE